MSEPGGDSIQFECIGCGTRNPAGSSVCAGCGHTFAGPGHESITEMANRLAPPIRSEIPRPIAKGETGLLGCLVNVVGVILAGVVVFATFIVAFGATCSALWNQHSDSAIGLGILAGVCAAVAMIAFFVWIGSILRSQR